MSNKKIPKNYFERLHKNIVQNINGIDDDISVNAPNLSRINKINIYSIPKNYFEQNLDKILNKKESKIRFLPKYISLVAASFLILIAVTWLMFNDLKVDELQTAELSETTFIDYLIENSEDIDNSFFISLNDGNEFINEDVDFEEVSNEELNIYLEEIVDEISFEDLEILNI